MLKLSVCPAVVEDAQAIATLNEVCFGQSYPVAEIQKQIKAILLSSDERLLVAVYRGNMIGYIHVRDDRRTYRAPRKLVLAIAVDKDFRRKGVATCLFRAIEELAKQDSCEAVSAAVGGSRAAQGFFTAVGFEERLNRKQYIKSVIDPKSPIIERLEQHGKKE